MKLKEQYNNPLAVPRLKKIVVNVGLGEALNDRKILKKVGERLKSITGQKPVVTKASRSISDFKLRAGESVGLKVTLRRKRMHDFLQKLISIVLPRLRDFRGIDPGSFDGQGNISLGFSDYSVFPELDDQEVESLQGMEATIVTSTKNDQEAKKLLTELGFPFSDKE